jgi:dolichol-phosphate mannosyltransferase
MQVRDVTAGFKAYRGEVLANLELATIKSEGYCFQVDLVNRARNRGHCICEVPIVFVERELGVSKMNKKIVQEALKRVTIWGLTQRITGKRY